MNASDRAQVLARTVSFAAVPHTHLAMLAEMMQPEVFAAGATVVEQDEHADCIYVVASGSLSVFAAGIAEAVRTLGPGEVLGEYGMVGDAVRTATVRAKEESVLLSLDYERLREYLLLFPDALWVLFDGAVRRLVDAERRIRELSRPLT